MAQVVGESANPAEDGLVGRSRDGFGARAFSQNSYGVLGETSAAPASNKAGVAGFHQANGVGVWGESGAGNGVVGISKDLFGVLGNSQTSHGVVGETSSDASRGHAGVEGRHLANGTGVIGNSGSGAGMIGVAQTGIGVIGETKTATGIGILGRGGRLAGKFEGNVEVTGLIFMGGDTDNSLAVWINRVSQLESQVADLRTRLASIPTGSTGDTTGGVSIDSELILQPGPFNQLRIFGKGFVGGELIEFTTRSTTGTAGSGAGSTSIKKAEPSGDFEIEIGVPCTPGQQTTHTAFARGTASGRISPNTARSC